MGKINKAQHPLYFFGKITNIFLNKIKHYHKIALFLDYDGTLVPIQKDPMQCFLSVKTKKQLQTLADSNQCYITVLSGRSLPDIKKRVGIHKIYYGGNHGLNITGPDLRYTHPKVLSSRPIIRRAKYLLKKEIASIKGAWLEDKKFTLSLHFRLVKKEKINGVKKIFYKTLKKFPEGKSLSVIKGKKVLELMPNISWDKGRAAIYILQRLKDKSLPIYIGDDKTDETVFKAFHKSGIAIRVGKSKKTYANYYLKNQLETLRFLRKMAEFIISN